jgi:hypothetical protein
VCCGMALLSCLIGIPAVPARAAPLLREAPKCGVAIRQCAVLSRMALHILLDWHSCSACTRGTCRGMRRWNVVWQGSARWSLCMALHALPHAGGLCENVLFLRCLSGCVNVS